jgi:HrpA-like RNA helicase
VFDFGLYKELNYSSHNRMERLDLKYASRASLEQRKGRAGRVNKGYCFRIMTEN